MTERQSLQGLSTPAPRSRPHVAPDKNTEHQTWKVCLTKGMTRLRVRSNAGAIALLLAASLIGASCSVDSQDSDGAANFYESLDLASPSEAVETFTDAFAEKDFMTVWLAFDINAQQRVENYFNLLQWPNLIRTDAVPNIGSETASILSLDNLETTDRWYLFDVMMTTADEHDAYLIDLSGAVTISEESQAGDDAEVSTVVEGINGDVRFRLVQSPTGRWRVYQVIVPGGDEDLIPWSVPQP